EGILVMAEHELQSGASAGRRNRELEVGPGECPQVGPIEEGRAIPSGDKLIGRSNGRVVQPEREQGTLPGLGRQGLGKKTQGTILAEKRAIDAGMNEQRGIVPGNAFVAAVQIGAVDADDKIVVALAGEIPVREIARFEAA